MIFKKDGFVCNVEQDKYEQKEHLIVRGYFVVSQKPITKEQYDEAILYSRIYVNTKFKKCLYNDEITHKLETMVAKV